MTKALKLRKIIQEKLYGKSTTLQELMLVANYNDNSVQNPHFDLIADKSNYPKWHIQIGVNILVTLDLTKSIEEQDEEVLDSLIELIK